MKESLSLDKWFQFNPLEKTLLKIRKKSSLYLSLFAGRWRPCVHADHNDCWCMHQVIDGLTVKQTGDSKETAAYLTLMTRYLQSYYQVSSGIFFLCCIVGLHSLKGNTVVLFCRTCALHCHLYTLFTHS